MVAASEPAVGSGGAFGQATAAAETIVATCRAAGVRLVRFLYCDNGGVVRGKCVSVEGLAERMQSGIGLTVAMQAMNSLDQLQPVPGMGPVGEIRLVPDPGTFTGLPYAPHTAAMLVDHVGLDGTPYAACPRRFLARMAERLEEQGITTGRCANSARSSVSLTKNPPCPESVYSSAPGMNAVKP